MRVIWGFVGVYGILGAIFFLFNPEWALASFPIAVFGVPVTIPLILLLFLVSLLFLVFQAMVATWTLDTLKRAREQLQAQLFEKSIAEIEHLRTTLEAQFAACEDTLLRAIENLGRKLSPEDPDQPSSGH